MTPEDFFKKNLKWITLTLFLLLCFFFIKSCNNNMGNRMATKKYTHTIDSLNKKYDNYYTITQDSIKELNFELKLAREKANMANDKAQAVQSAVEKIRNNTSITIRGAEEVKDSLKKK